MIAAGSTTPAQGWLRTSGLDTSGGTDFIQARIALFAKVLAAIALVFLAVSVITGLAFRLPIELFLGARQNFAHFGGTLWFLLVWLVCRRKQLSLRQLSFVDAAALVGSCTAW